MGIMSLEGYTKSYRAKWQNPVFRNLLEAAIWGWMCDTAAWKDTRVRFNGEMVDLKRGQLITSITFIAQGFGIGEQVTRTFLENIKKDEMVNVQPTRRGTIITIHNYDKFQTNEEATNTQTNNHPTCSQHSPNTNKNELKNLRTKEIEVEGKPSKPAKRASRLPDDWVLPQDWGEWAEKEGLSDSEILREAEKFKDHWQSTGNTKADWEATWRNWIRRKLDSK
jgi:hypothetical protein